MLTFLDLLVVVFVGMSALSLLAICFMFLVRKPTLRKISFYLVVAFGIYASTVGLRINGFMFPLQTAIAVILGLLSIAALILERLSKGNKRKYLIARILAAAALIAGMLNAFIF